MLPKITNKECLQESLHIKNKNLGWKSAQSECQKWMKDLKIRQKNFKI